MSYVDGFVAAVPTANKALLQAHIDAAGIVFMEHGATQYVECWGDEVPDGELTSFPMAVKCQPDETVIFSWVIWPSKAVRDAGMKKVMDDPRLQPEVNPMPFDARRLIFGGFVPLIHLTA